MSLEAKIAPLRGNSFEFKAEGEHADLTGTQNPVTVKLAIGDDSGSASVMAKFDHNEPDGDNHDGNHEQQGQH